MNTIPFYILPNSGSVVENRLSLSFVQQNQPEKFIKHIVKILFFLWFFFFLKVGDEFGVTSFVFLSKLFIIFMHSTNDG